MKFTGLMNIIDCLIYIPLFCIASSLIVPDKTKYDFVYMYEISIGILVFSTVLLILIILSYIIEYV